MTDSTPGRKSPFSLKTFIVASKVFYFEAFLLFFLMDFLLSVGSVVGLKGNAGQCVYSASKAGLEGFTRSLAKEVASRNISVNLLAPGTVQLHLCSYSTFSSQHLLFSCLSHAFSLASRFHPHRHDRRTEGGRRGAFYPTGEIWRAG